ncbi:MAG: BLUF domain-containing protein [Kiritimatiellae bacterium]|nr:BLUF domain-containing protein [Kiritimatiellia bacterium]MDY0149520.1 BLUF domain-containing protein [Kiritimatiellia bacterium]
MKIVRLIYASRLTRDTGPDALGKIMTVSRRNNKKLGVTGALCYSPRGFLQILEGPADMVNQLYVKIIKDKRHSAVTLLEYSDIPYRDFENWSMAYVRADEIARTLLQKFSTRKLFDPFEMGPTQARGFLMAVTKERADFLAKQEAAIRKS